MSVFFRLHQDKSVGTKRSGKWYARMVPMGVIDTRRLAEKQFLQDVQLEELPENKVEKKGE